MAVNVFPAPAAAATGGTWVRLSSTAQTISKMTRTWAPGLYKFSAFAPTFNASPIATVTFFNGGGSVIATATTIDSDSGSTVNGTEVHVYLSSAATELQIRSTTGGTLVKIEALPLDVYLTGELSQYTTSQTITIPATSDVLIIGAGGNGANADNSARGGGGGGSGYISTFSLAAGSYALVVGAAPGGATTLAGYTANGGSSGSAGAGGNGGSGGGAVNNWGVGHNGGANGANGTSGSAGAGGTGSGVTPPAWAPPSVAGIGGTQTGGGGVGGTAGGFYGGGGGGSHGNGSYSGSVGGSATAGSGGGGGGGSNMAPGNAGGTGGSGAAYVLSWV